MRVIDARSFDIPSDENDYDELVAFADTMACIPQFDAVPIEMLDKIRAEIENHCGLTKENHCRYCSYCNSVMGVREILEIFDKYKAETEET